MSAGTDNRRLGRLGSAVSEPCCPPRAFGKNAKTATWRAPQTVSRAARMPCHAVRARSRGRRPRPNVEIRGLVQLWTRLACAKARKTRRLGKIATRRPPQPTRRAAPRPTTLRALAPQCVGRGPMSSDPLLCSHGVRARVRKRAGGAERLGGVGQGDFLRSVFLSSAGRTWSGHESRDLSGLDPCLFRRVTTTARYCTRTRQPARPEQSERGADDPQPSWPPK